MKPILLFLLSSLLFSTTTKAEEFDNTKLIFWPRYNWVGGEFELLCKEKLKDGDSIMISYFQGLKDGFRSSKYSINKRKVTLQFPALPSASEMEDILLKKQNGIGGHFFQMFQPDLAFSLNQSNFQNVRRKGEQLRSRQIFAIDHPTSRRPANLKLLTPDVEHVSIYLDRCLTAKRKTVVSFIKKTSGKLRELNADVDIWLSIELLNENNDIDDIVSLLESTKADVDGYVFVFGNSKENEDDASNLLKRLRK